MNGTQHTVQIKPTSITAFSMKFGEVFSLYFDIIF